METALRIRRKWKFDLGLGKTRLTKLALFMAVLLASILRLWNPGMAEFKFDEAHIYLLARDIALKGAHPVWGVTSSIGLPNPPLTPYIYASVLRLWPTPLSLVILVASLNAVAVGITYLWAQAVFGPQVAFMAAILFAVNPWSVLMGRKIWTQSLVPFFSSLFTGTLVLAVERRRAHLFAMALLLALLAALTYLPAAILLLEALTVMALFRRRTPWRLLAGMAFALALAASPVILPYRENLWHALRALGERSDWGIKVDTAAFRLALWLVSGYNVEGVLWDYASLFRPCDLLLKINACLTALLLLAGGLLAVKGTRKGGRNGALALFACFALPPFLLLFHPLPLYPHYLLVVYPAGFVLMALALHGLPSSKSTRPLAIGLFLFLTISQLISMGRLYGLLMAHAPHSGFGVPLGSWLSLAREVEERAREAGLTRVYVMAQGQDPSVEGEPAILTAVLGPGMEPRFAATDSLLLPEGEAALCLMTRSSTPWEAFLSRGGVEVPLPTWPGLDEVRLWTILPDTARAWLEQWGRALNGHFLNGVELLGYVMPRRISPGQTLPLILFWRFAQVPRGGDVLFSAFNHLIGPDGHRYGQHDGFTGPTSTWREGEVLIRRYAIPLPADAPTGEYWVHTGMYDLATLQRVGLKEGGEFLRLGPVEVSP